MILTSPDRLQQFIADHSAFYVIGHEEPDGDCICSQITLGMLLSDLGKKYKLLSPGPFIRPEIAHFEPLFSLQIEPFGPEDNIAVFVVDCSTPERLGALSPSITDYEVAVIDHHAAGTTFGSVRLVDPNAPSVTYLILGLMESYGLSPTQEQAELLLFGLATDTGFFRHLEADSGPVFAASSRLVAAGASPKLIHSWMYGNRPFESRSHLSSLLNRTKPKFSGRLLVTYEILSDRQGLPEGARDSDTLYQLLTTVKDVEAVVFLREEDGGTCSVSLRSNFDLDVGTIARDFGGGGHKKAAGYDFTGTLEEAEQAAIDALRPHFAGS